MRKKLRAVVTGASGFLGSALTKKLLSEGWEVTAAVRKESGIVDELRGSGAVIRCSGSDDFCYPAAEDEDCDVFYHFAWDGTSPEMRNDREKQNGNIEYSVAAAKAAAEHGCGVFVFAGSQAEYGRHTGKIKEDAACLPVSEYGKAKLAAARECEKIAVSNGMKFLHLRIFNIYGPRDRDNSLVSLCCRTFEKGGCAMLSSCTQIWNYLYIDDFTEAVYKLSAAAVSDIDRSSLTVNIGSRISRPLYKYVEEIYSDSSKNGTYKRNGGIVNPEGSPSVEPDISVLNGIIGFTERYSFEDGIKETLENERKNNFISDPLL